MNNQSLSHPGNAKSVPGPRGNLLFGTLLEYLNDPIGFIVNVVRKYGDVVKIRNAYITEYVVSHPDGVERILHDNHRNYTRNDSFVWDKAKIALGESLLTTDGDNWRDRRRLMQPVFHHRSVANFESIITHHTSASLDAWQSYVNRKQPIDIATEMTRLTLQILLESLFTAEIQKETSSIGWATTVQNQDLLLRTAIPFYPPPFIPTFHNLRLNKALHMLDEIMYRLIADHRNHPENTRDLLSLLIQSRDEETGETLRDEQLRGELLALFFAGHETTANTLAWLFYLLSSHPDVVMRLQAEIDAYVGQRLPSVQDLSNLPYSQLIISETLRLYPPSWITTRKALADDEICGYYIPRGAIINLCSYVTHRHPAFWENPDDFDPDRFSAERSAGRPRYAYFPFLRGPHQCIGKDFALLEVQLVLIMVMQRYRLELVSDTTIEPLITLRPRGGLPMKIHYR
jgi:cytochrome P450